SAGLFYDIGSIWDLDNTGGGSVDDSRNMRSAIGMSLFWDTAIGPLQFNFSRPIQKEAYDRTRNFEFTISTKF
ncbi:MAG: BamA/TamA family outer membrane protein, partial [Halocynthiibacter sp.]